MLNTLKSYGCSFVYGSDLSDTSDQQIKPSQLTWPALVARDLEMEYKCYAHPGVGNNYIAQQVVSNADPDSLNVIVWTWIDRWEFFDIADNHWTTVRPTGTEDHPLADIYYKHLQSELQDKWQSLNYIYSTHEYLRKHNIPFVSHIMDELLLDLTHHAPSYVATLQDDIRECILRFPTFTTFLAWSKLNDFDISERLHPLEEAHAGAKEIWLETYKQASI